jgi:hypothetical protein
MRKCWNRYPRAGLEVQFDNSDSKRIYNINKYPSKI